MQTARRARRRRAVNAGGAAVGAQYEAWPYPARDPRDEARRLVAGSPSHFDELVHYAFGGNDPAEGGARFRVLVAGGGTGDAAIMLAQQLADRGADALVTWLDLSRAAMRIAQARARARRLRNIRFVRASLLEIGARGLGPFDYIDCCGVLHHLEDPAAGLRALAAALADGGAMGLMVYGALGRAGVYDAQQALRLLGAGAEAPKERLALARRFLDALPPGNRLRRNPWVADHLQGGDAGLYDLLLHARDRAYAVPETFALARAAGLDIAAFIEPVRYDPASWLGDDLGARAARLSWPDRCALAELVAGNIKRHVFYAVPAGAPRRPPEPRMDSIPVLRGFDGGALAREAAAAGALSVELEGSRFRYRFGPLAPAILSRIDGKRSLAAIRAGLAAPCGEAEFEAAFADLYGKLNGANILLLRNPPARA